MRSSSAGTLGRRWARSLVLPLAIPVASLLILSSPAHAAGTGTFNIPGTATTISAVAATGVIAAPNDSITFTYNGGTININPNGGTPGSSNNPNLLPNGGFSQTSTAKGFNFASYDTSSAPYHGTTPPPQFGQLLYSIGSPSTSTIHAVPFNDTLQGNSTATVTAGAGESGQIYLFVEDTTYNDNSGSYSITVTDSLPGTGTGGTGGTATPEAPAGLLFAVGMLPLAGLVAWRRKRAEQPHDEL